MAGKINITNSTAILRINRSDTFLLGNEISGDGRVAQIGDGTTILTANNAYGGTTTISDGILQIGNGGTSGTAGAGGINITNNTNNSTIGTLRINRSDAFLLTNTISGIGQFDQAGSGVTTLAGNNTFTGVTTVASGTLKLNASSGTALGGTESVTVNSGAILLLSKSDQVNNLASITLSGGTIERAGGVSEVFGDLDLTAASFLDYGIGDTGTLTFGTYTPSALLTVNNFFEGNKLVFSSDLTGQITGNFDFDNDFMANWNGSTFTITAIPEPSAYVAITGLIALMLWSWRRRLNGTDRQFAGKIGGAR